MKLVLNSPPHDGDLKSLDILVQREVVVVVVVVVGIVNWETKGRFPGALEVIRVRNMLTYSGRLKYGHSGRGSYVASAADIVVRGHPKDHKQVGHRRVGLDL